MKKAYRVLTLLLFCAWSFATHAKAAAGINAFGPSCITYEDDLEVFINQNSSYLMPGQEFEFSIVARCEMNVQITKVLVGDEAVKWVKGEVLTYRFPVESPGTHEVPVRISYKDSKGKTKQKRYTVAFTVGLPSTAIALDRMNLLYIGMDNPMTVATTHAGAENVIVTIVGGGGTLTMVGSGKYIVRVKTPTDDCRISVSVDGKIVERTQFRVRHIPPPVVIVGGHTSGDSISAKVFLGQEGVAAGLRGVPIDIKYTVVSYTLTVYDEKGIIKSIDSEGPAFSPEVKKFMSEYVKPGTIVTFGNLYVLIADGRKEKLAPAIYHIK